MKTTEIINPALDFTDVTLNQVILDLLRDYQNTGTAEAHLDLIYRLSRHLVRESINHEDDAEALTSDLELLRGLQLIEDDIRNFSLREPALPE